MFSVVKNLRFSVEISMLPGIVTEIHNMFPVKVAIMLFAVVGRCRNHSLTFSFTSHPCRFSNVTIILSFSN